MVDRDRELQRLADADRHIREAERNVSEQRLQLKKRLQQGRRDANAQRTLGSFRSRAGEPAGAPHGYYQDHRSDR